MEKKTQKNNLIEFIKKSKYSILIIVLVALFAFGQRLISGSFSIDTELYIEDIGSATRWDWWLSLNRWGLIVLNQVLQMGALPIFASNYLTVVLMVVYSVAFNYLFYTYLSDKYKESFLKYQFIFPILFISNPVFAEHYNFIIQNVGVAIGVLMVPVSQLLIHKALTSEELPKKIGSLIISIGMIAFSFGIYQSIPLLYVVTVVACYLLKVLKEKDNNWKFLGKQIGIFVLGAILYFIICKITAKSGTGYLQSAWLKDSVSQCLLNIWNCIKPVFGCEGIFYNYGYVLAVGVLVVLIGILIKKKSFKIGVILAVLGLIMAPFYIMILTGVDQYKRTQFNYSFVIGFVMMLAIVFLANRNKGKIVKNIMIVLAAIIVYSQSYACANLFYSVDVVFENDKAFGLRLVDKVEEQEWYEAQKDYKLIFIGQHSAANLKNLYQKSEVIGKSFFEFDYENIWGVNDRANALLRILGYEFQKPTAKDFEEAKNYAKETNMEVWPKNGSIQLVDDKILIRLSEEY